MVLLNCIGLMKNNWNESIGDPFLQPSLDSFLLILGTDLFGRSIIVKLMFAINVAFQIGMVTVIVSTPFGLILGLISGFYGKTVDAVIRLVTTSINSIPTIMLVIVITFFLGKGFFALTISLTLTHWTTFTQVIRSEVMKEKQKDYVTASKLMKAHHFRILFGHILPNLTHLIWYHVAICFMSAIKSEVVFSFLGIGIQGTPSLGIMLDDARLELPRGNFAQFISVTCTTTMVILAFYLLTNSLKEETYDT